MERRFQPIMPSYIVMSAMKGRPGAPRTTVCDWNAGNQCTGHVIKASAVVLDVKVDINKDVAYGRIPDSILVLRSNLS